MLILVILMSTIFAGIAMRAQNRALELPDVLRDDQIKRETENVSDYALRYAIAYAIPRIRDWVRNEWQTVIVKFDGGSQEVGSTVIAPKFTVGKATIDQITFNHIGGTFTGNNREIRFQAVSQVTGILQGKTIIYPAELAFNYFKGDTPNCFYYEMNQAQLEGQADMNDTSGNGNNAYPFNGLHTFPTPGDGVAGWKCGFWHNDFNDAAYAPNSVNHTMEVDTTFTLVCFAKADKNLKYRNAALVWLPSVHPQTNPYAAPSTAIWYGGFDGMMHYTVGLNNNGPNNWLEVRFPYRDLMSAYSTGSSGQGYRNFPWEFFALTFNKGTLKAYYNGLPLNASYNNPITGSGQSASRSCFGVSVGSRITRVNGTTGDGFANSQFDMCFNGVLDQVGMFNRVLTDEEIWNFYNFTQMPTKVDYIRD
ncbi:MAG TPA: hypothetical protein PLG20_07005 [Candidatus Syntrophosphaera sp.]|nr:hypothetical protein [Candidatus Syntrophosphaera sp.]